MLAVVQKDSYQQKLDQAKASLAKSKPNTIAPSSPSIVSTVLYKAGAATQPDYDDSRAQEHPPRPPSTTPRRRSPKQTRSRLLRLEAPFDSWYLKRNVDMGSWSARPPTASPLADTRTVKAVFGVPDTAIGTIKLGSPQTVMTEALPDPFNGHVTAISAAADPKSRVYSVEVRIDNQQNLLKAGMIASITIGNPARRAGDGGADFGCRPQPIEPRTALPSLSPKEQATP